MRKSEERAIRERLLSLRAACLAETVAGKNAAGVVELDQTRLGRLSRMDALQAQAMSQASGRRRELMLKKIDAALRRLERDEYGYCQHCEASIAPKRLEFDPVAGLCIGCAEQAER